MSEIWPFDVQQRLVFAPREADQTLQAHPPLCLFQSRFNQVADLIDGKVKTVFDGLRKGLSGRGASRRTT